MLIAIWLTALGLIVGSYLNVVIYRVPRQKSTVFPASACTACGYKLRAIDNVPVLSYLWLRGKCRGCGVGISPRYPINELLTAALFLAAYLRFGFTWAWIPASVFCAFMVVLANIDVEHFLLPDKIVFPGLIVGLLLQPISPWATWLEALLGVLIGAGLLILLINAWYWLRQEEAMGLGDVNMLAMIGAFLGWQGVLVTLTAASLAGALAGIGIMVSGRGSLKSQLPFGLFLAIGAILTLFWGGPLISSYRLLL